MLVLTRKRGQRIRIGEDVEIVILKSSTGKVSVGIVAPEEKKVLRGELVGKPKAA